MVHALEVRHASFKNPECGDGEINQPTEQCDDGNTVSGDCCSATCQVESCGLVIQVEGHADVTVPCSAGDFDCQSREVCNAVTGYSCLFQQYDCYFANQGSYYPPDGNSGSSSFNFAITYDFSGGDYGNICACNSSQVTTYGLAATHTYCGLGHWTRVP